MEDYELDELVNKISGQSNILGKEDYFNSAVLISLVKNKNEYKFLFQKRSAHVSQGGEICFPGGKHEPEDPDYQTTALREVEEELGIRPDLIEVKGKLGTVITTIGATIDSFIGICRINSLEELKLNPSEVEEAFTLPVSYFRKTEPERYKIKVEAKPYYEDKNGEKVTLLPVEELGLPDRYRSTWEGAEHEIYVYQTKEGIIWGITAQLIVEFINRLPDNINY